MKPLLPLLAALAIAAPAQAQQRYLVSIVDLPLGENEALARFAFTTWSVEFDALCRVPPGWQITLGKEATPFGALSGEGSHGVTWFRTRNPEPLTNLALITVDGPVERKAHESIPATFTGEAVIWTGTDERKATLSADNLRLVPAKACPAP